LVLAFRAEVAHEVRPAEFRDESGLIQALSTGVQPELGRLSGHVRRALRLAPRPVFLAGREELLAELDARLAAVAGAGPRVVALCGLGGAGKTSVAVEYAYRHLAEVGVAWQFAADNQAVLAAGFGELAAQLGASGPAVTRDPVASVNAVLAAYPAGWLLVFDSAPDRASVTPFLPPAGRGRVLITTRSALWPPGEAMDVLVLDPQVAAEFLVNRTGDPDRQAALGLAGELGGLPLALEQAAAYIQASGDSLAGYLASFRRRPTEMLARGEPTGYSKTVATTWRLAFEHLQQAAPGAVGLLRLLAFCAPEAIPLPLLLRPCPGLGDQLGAEVAPVLVPLLEDELAAKDAITALRRYSLISPSADGSVSVHRLVQAITVDQMPAELAAAWQQAAAAVIETALPADPRSPETWAVFASLLPHVKAAPTDNSSGMWRVASYLGYSGSYAAARDLQQRVLDTRVRVSGPDHPDTLRARAHLARWTGEAGDAAGARDQFAALLPVVERVLGPEHPDTLVTRRDLARWTGETGDAAGAHDLYVAQLSSPPPLPVVDEDVRFTVYRPQVLSPGRWASLLVFTHKTNPVVEPGRVPVDPTEEVEARARAHFGDATPRPVGEDARHGLTRGARLRIVPDLPGLRCNPEDAEVEWWEPVHEVVFRLLAGPELVRTVVHGAVRVWYGPLIIGEVSIAVPVAMDDPAADALPIAESVQRYRKIFPSYSHRDRAVVASFAEAARALGDQYLQDVLTLRPGEPWNARLLELIEDADVFQLFWSRNSMRSPHCQHEWKHALALHRSRFIRPIYWEEPLPQDPGRGLPPAALLALHFVKVPVAGMPGQDNEDMKGGFSGGIGRPGGGIERPGGVIEHPGRVIERPGAPGRWERPTSPWPRGREVPRPEPRWSGRIRLGIANPAKPGFVTVHKIKLDPKVRPVVIDRARAVQIGRHQRQFSNYRYQMVEPTASLDRLLHGRPGVQRALAGLVANPDSRSAKSYFRRLLPARSPLAWGRTRIMETSGPTITRIAAHVDGQGRFEVKGSQSVQIGVWDTQRNKFGFRIMRPELSLAHVLHDNPDLTRTLATALSNPDNQAVWRSLEGRLANGVALESDVIM